MTSIPRPARRPALRRAGLVLAALLALTLAWQAATRLGRATGYEQVRAQAAAGVAAQAALLESELNKFRALPFVLAQDDVLRQTLLQPDPARLQALDRKLETLPAGTGAAVVYLLNADGVAIAASNWREPTSFVGSDYRFRPYYSRAWRHGSDDHFALGTVSRQPGLYLSRRIDDGDGAPLGVLVVKVEFARLEAIWRESPEALFVTDARGIVLFGNRPAWRFMTLAPIAPDEAARLRDSLQFGDAPLTPLPLAPLPAPSAVPVSAPLPDSFPVSPPATRGGLPSLVENEGAGYLHARQAIADPAWTLHALVPVDAAVAAEVSQARQVGMLAALLAMGLAAVLYARAMRRRGQMAEQRRRRAELEAAVALRTEQLRHSNAQLHAEMEDRQRTQARARVLQAELEQANKLSFLGQIAAGIGHEINQPVAAIRTYAENAGLFLAQGQAGPAGENLRIIAGLTERIGRITGQLRDFARKPAAEIADVPLREAIDGALLLLAPRARQQDVAIDAGAVPAALSVRAERMRVEQVLVNLMQNALDALRARPGGRIVLAAERDGAQVRLTVADNGPGLSAAALATLFTPFSSDRPDGLGLGLVICRDIAEALGGSLRADAAAAEGAVFVLTLPAAQP